MDADVLETERERFSVSLPENGLQRGGGLCDLRCGDGVEGVWPSHLDIGGRQCSSWARELGNGKAVRFGSLQCCRLCADLVSTQSGEVGYYTRWTASQGSEALPFSSLEGSAFRTVLRP